MVVGDHRAGFESYAAVFTGGDIRTKLLDRRHRQRSDALMVRMLVIVDTKTRTFTLKPGMSYQLSDFGDAAHRSSTKTGAKLFVVD